MFGAEANCTPIWVQAQFPIASRNCISKPRTCFLKNKPNPSSKLGETQNSFALSHSISDLTLQRRKKNYTYFSLNASAASVGSAEYAEEPATKVAFQTTLNLPSCSSSLSLLGTGFREKVFAIIGVKVYAVGLYVNPSVFSKLDSWNGRSAAEIQEDSSVFSSIFQAPLEKSLQIVLVRDVDGKTFWDALDDAISPRIKSTTPVDETALFTFRSIFQGRPLKKGTFIFLTWLDPSKMLIVEIAFCNACHGSNTNILVMFLTIISYSDLYVSVSSDGLIPSSVDATIESEHVASALFDVFFGEAPVSLSLKASVANGLATNLK